MITVMSRLLLFTTLTLTCLLATGGQAMAYNLGGKKWPTRTITYYNGAKQHNWAFRQAVRSWNSSGVRIKFRATSRRRARLIVTHYPKNRIKNSLQGEATLGYVRRGLRRDPYTKGRGGGRMWLTYLNTRDRERFKYEMAAVIAHELGHIIGLDHYSKGCVTMSPIVQVRCSRPSQPWVWRCRILERDDLLGAKRRYGGTVRVNPNVFCDKWAAPLAVQNLRAVETTPGQVQLDWTNPDSPHMDAVRVVMQKDRCPASIDDGVYSDEAGATANTMQSLVIDAEGYEAGNYCIAIWTREQFTRYGPVATIPVVLSASGE